MDRESRLAVAKGGRGLQEVGHTGKSVPASFWGDGEGALLECGDGGSTQ